MAGAFLGGGLGTRIFCEGRKIKHTSKKTISFVKLPNRHDRQLVTKNVIKGSAVFPVFIRFHNICNFAYFM